VSRLVPFFAGAERRWTNPVRTSLRARSATGPLVTADGRWSEYAYDERHYTIGETIGFRNYTLASFTYERDPGTRTLEAVRLTCLSESGDTVSEFSPATAESVDELKDQLVRHVRCTLELARRPLVH
jgi:hypothetical protein